MEHVGTLVIGAGFGGLSAALSLAESGEDVLICESLNYPGGCASTFRRRGYQFEAGATLSSGLGPNQLFARWIDRYGLPVEAQPLNPVVEQRSPLGSLSVLADRAAFVAHLMERAPTDLRAGVGRFFDRQRRVAQTLWSMLDDPAMLPPWDGLKPVWRHAARVGQYVGLLPLLGQSLTQVMARDGVDGWPLLKLYADAVSQITVQASADEAEAAFALGTLDYFWRGTYHVRGGIGRLARALLDAAQRAGARAWMPCEVRALAPLPGPKGRGWVAQTRRGPVTAQRVVANVLPQRLRALLDAGRDAQDTQDTQTTPAISPSALAALDALSARVESGWGAAMLYGVLSPGADLPDGAHHLDLTLDPSAPLTEGNHVFCSISGVDEVERVKTPGERTLTASTHVPMATLRALPPAEVGPYIQTIQDRMRRAIAALAPEVTAHLTWDMPASPRTFARFTGRPWGYVGGVPRRVGWAHYGDPWRGPHLDGLRLVGDSVFPGQSTLAAALGGVKAAQGLLKARG